MRYPFLFACAMLLPPASASAPTGEAHYVFAVTSLPAGVQMLLQARHGDIPDRASKLGRTCLIDPDIVGQRLATARVEAQRVQVDIEYAHRRELTRIVFRLDEGEWVHASTDSVVPMEAQQSAFAAAFQKVGGHSAWTPLPTDGTIEVPIPKE